MYNYNHLYYFYVTARSGGVNAAAKHLRISQPSLSNQLKVLEQSLNIKLFQKVGRSNQLTRSGAVIFGFCRHMFETSEAMSEAILQKVPSETRRIHIGVSDEVERSFVVDVVSQFLKKQNLTSRPKVTIMAGTQTQLIERLKFRELDIIITELAMSDPDLMNLACAETPVVLACPKPWTIPRKIKDKKISTVLSEIVEGADAQWIMPSSRFKLRSEIDHFFEENELKGRIVIESDVLASLIRSVVDELGLAFIPLFYMGREMKEKSLQIIGPKNGYWKYRVWVACNQQSKTDKLINSFAEAFIELAPK